jgi:hypothetical protein
MFGTRLDLIPMFGQIHFNASQCRKRLKTGGATDNRFTES